MPPVYHPARRLHRGSFAGRKLILAHSFPVAITGREVAFNQDMKALVPNGDYSRDYIFNWFQWSKGSLLRNVSESSHGTKRLTSDVLFSKRIPKVSREEQKDFVEVVSRTGKISAEAISHSACSIDLLTTLLNTIFR